MHWLIVGNGTAHRKTTAVMSQKIHASTMQLLRLLCCKEPCRAIELWQSVWDEANSYEQLPPGSKELLPMAFCHLEDLDIAMKALPFPSDCSQQKLNGKCKAIWARNVLVMKKAHAWNRLLRNGGLRPIAIKGVATLASNPRLMRCRQTIDVDFFVNEEQWELAEEILKRSGEFHEYDAPKQWAEGRGWLHVHAQHWRSCGIELDLHRRPQPGFLEDTLPFRFSEAPIQTSTGLTIPNRRDHASILCLHAFTHSNVSSGASLRYLPEVLSNYRLTTDAKDQATSALIMKHDHGSRIIKQLARLQPILTGALHSTAECFLGQLWRG